MSTNVTFLLFCRVQLGDHDLGPLLDGLRTPTDYVLAGKKSFFMFWIVIHDKAMFHIFVSL